MWEVEISNAFRKIRDINKQIQNMDKLNIYKSKLFQEGKLSDLYVGDSIYSGSQRILDNFRQHFEQLAVDRSDMAFDDQYHRTDSYEVSIITKLIKDKEIPEVSNTELTNAIKTLIKGKAPDFMECRYNIY